MLYSYPEYARRFDSRVGRRGRMSVVNEDYPVRSGLGLRGRIESALRAAEVKQNGDHARLLRLLLCAIRDHEAVAGGSGDCDDGKIAQMLQGMIRQRRDGMAGHDRSEADFLEGFLPTPLSDDQMRAAAHRIAGELGARGLRDLGSCVREIKARFPGRVESGRINDIVRQALVGNDRGARA